MKFLTSSLKKQEEAYDILPNTKSSEIVDLPKKSEDRRITDIFFFILFIIFITISTCFVIYTLSYSDMDRLAGYDKCGNVCGKKNMKYERWNCTGQDMTQKPYAIRWEGRCTDNNEDNYTFQKPLGVFFKSIAGKIILTLSIPFGVSILLLVMFRYATAVAVWGVLFLSWFSFIALSCLLAYSMLWVIPLIPLTFISVVSFFWLIMQKENVRLVTELYRETTKITLDIPKTLVVPIVTIAVLLVAAVTYTLTTIAMSSAGILTNIYDDRLRYVPTTTFEVTLFVICPIATIWFFQFVMGIAYTTVSGTVAKWYFSGKPEELDGSVKTSFQNTVRNHLGTVALGSLMISSMSGVRAALMILAQITMLQDVTAFLLKYVNGFFTRNVYIMTAMHGTSFAQSGKRAVKNFSRNIGDTVAIDRFNDIVIMLSQFLVVFISSLSFGFVFQETYFGVYDIYNVILASGVIYVAIFSTLGTLRVAASTMYFCACEESVMNEDGDMSLKQFLKASNNVFIKKIKERAASKQEKF